MQEYSYQAQLSRTKRYYNRIQNKNRNQMDYEDDLWSFFIHAWHLNDWLWHDPDISLPFKNHQEFKTKLLKDYPNIAICHDIANKSKHFILKGSSDMNATYKASVKVSLPMQYVLATEKHVKRTEEKVSSE